MEIHLLYVVDCILFRGSHFKLFVCLLVTVSACSCSCGSLGPGGLFFVTWTAVSVSSHNETAIPQKIFWDGTLCVAATWVVSIYVLKWVWFLNRLIELWFGVQMLQSFFRELSLISNIVYFFYHFRVLFMLAVLLFLGTPLNLASHTLSLTPRRAPISSLRLRLRFLGYHRNVLILSIK